MKDNLCCCFKKKLNIVDFLDKFKLIEIIHNSSNYDLEIVQCYHCKKLFIKEYISNFDFTNSSLVYSQINTVNDGHKFYKSCNQFGDLQNFITNLRPSIVWNNYDNIQFFNI